MVVLEYSISDPSFSEKYSGKYFLNGVNDTPSYAPTEVKTTLDALVLTWNERESEF